MPAKKTPIEWGWIEEQWQKGNISNVAIGKAHKEQFGVSVGESLIRYRASAYGWQRDLADSIKKETWRKVAESSVPLSKLRETANGTATSQIVDAAIDAIDNASSQAAKIVLSHRSYVERQHLIAFALESYVMKSLPLNQEGQPHLNYEPGELQSIAAAAACSSNIRHKAIEDERKAYGLDDADKGKPSADALLELRSFLGVSQ